MFDLVSLGNKLKTCRINLDCSIDQVSSSTGINSISLILYESGQKEPTGDEILILADFYKIDYKYFISNQQRSASENTESLYRKHGSEFSQSDRIAIRDFLFLCECEQALWDNLEIKYNKFHPQKIRSNNSKIQGKEIAKEFRNFLCLTDNQLIDNAFYLLRKTGVHIFRVQLENSNISGVFFNHPIAGKCILVNYLEDIYRQKFTLAHEYAHSIFDASDQFNISFFKEGEDLREIRANYFSSNFLIPSGAIKLLPDYIEITEEILLKMAKKLEINPEVLLYRLVDENRIHRNKIKELKKVKIPINEKIDPELKDLSTAGLIRKTQLLKKGLTQNYVLLCFRAFQQSLISKNRLAEVLLVDEFELSEILKLFNLKISYDI
ncbi:XRE family transcriptional regulator [Sphingobacterium siyangense]|uniref:XRE family transcriptional regulator n=1 Tax=Sphingobacterium siyangense TaxID=459529 RepID=UPI003DA622B8